MQDFFYYSMIRSKDENTTKTRKLDGNVPLDELPNLMRAMGYYPTNQEVQNMKDEVKFSDAASGPGLRSVFGQCHCVALVFKDFQEEFANAALVVNNE